ncbi:hypothetical protein EDD36DRAFT_460402 [Exophiala viscosa]|uniref:Uncharacterized protein n=1 Tax=Exophiala viscosa TaxID=2486360 RepID=A0AAN6E6I6_9EURO|nr:hypothetical protein EDD36DRAFT_460402 [Exophiala viscosa]
MPADRTTTVSYAVDLLRAHQLRRENAFLHKEVHACRNEIVAIHEELKEMRSTVEKCHTMSAATCTHSDELRVRAEEHARELFDIKAAFQATKGDVEDLKIAYDRIYKNVQAEVPLVKKSIDLAREDCERVGDEHTKQFDDVKASVAALQVLVDEKADMALLETLESRVNQLTLPGIVPHIAVRSPSRVPDSFERAKGVQVLDSQPADGHEDIPRSQSPGLPHVAIPKTANATILSDIDLDAKAETISYAGHQYHALTELDSLRFLPEPQAPASELAKINTLRQKRFEDWAEYYLTGQKLKAALPDSFEETIVRRFVEGVFQESRKRQCQQWLDSEGWTWDNVTLFNDMLSQDPKPSEPCSESGRAKVSLYSEKIGRIVKEREEPKTGVKRTGVSKKLARKQHLDANTEPVRRSQRLIEKETQTAHTAHVSLSNNPKPRKPAAKRNRDHHEQQSLSNTVGISDKLGNATAEANKEVEVQQTSAQAEAKDKETSTCMGKMVTTPPLQRTNSRPETRGIEVVRRRDQLLPQLVPQKRPLKDTAEDSSDDAGYLYGQGPAKRVVSEEQSRVRRPKERRLPLPPPPEIPILPTSSDE